MWHMPQILDLVAITPEIDEDFDNLVDKLLDAIGFDFDAVSEPPLVRIFNINDFVDSSIVVVVSVKMLL